MKKILGVERASVVHGFGLKKIWVLKGLQWFTASGTQVKATAYKRLPSTNQQSQTKHESVEDKSFSEALTLILIAPTT